MRNREEALERLLEGAGWAGAQHAMLADDASFRSYQRLTRNGERAVLMNAPPPREKVEPFMAIQDQLLALGFSAPRRMAADIAAGYLLLEDFGDRTFSRALAAGDDEMELYGLATDLLIDLHRSWPGRAGEFEQPAPYNEAELEREALLLLEWTYEAVCGKAAQQALIDDYLALWRDLWPAALAAPQTLVLRDYHVDNLMVLEDRQGTAACGLLDFQDALVGPTSYDLVSLLEDARRQVAPEVVEAMLQRYLAAFEELDAELFLRSYRCLGAQRNAKIIGIFTRLSRRDGKHGYLEKIPHVWRLLEGDLNDPFLTSLREWVDEVFPPDLRVMPERPAAS